MIGPMMNDNYSIAVFKDEKILEIYYYAYRFIFDEDVGL